MALAANQNFGLIGEQYKKRVIFGILLIAIVIFSGCKRNESKMTKANITTSCGIYQNNEWDSIEFSIDIDCVPDEDTAVSLAKSILINMKKDGKYPNYLPQSVFL